MHGGSTAWSLLAQKNLPDEAGNLMILCYFEEEENKIVKSNPNDKALVRLCGKKVSACMCT